MESQFIGFAKQIWSLKSMLIIQIILMQSRPLPNIARLIEKMTYLQTHYEQKMKMLQQCVVMMGLTGSAKSTLICKLAGIKCKTQKSFGKYLFSHNLPDYPKIGNTASSCTQVANLYKFNNDPNFYMDLPGLQDTHGQQQEILNSYSNSKVFKPGKKFKIVIVVEKSSFSSGKGGSFVEVAKRLRELFSNDFRQIISSCLLVVSKLNQNYECLVDIKHQINQILLSNNKLCVEGVMLIRELLNGNKIISFPQPDFLSVQKIDKIRQSITQLPFFMVERQPKISPSQASKNTINLLANYCEESKFNLAHNIGKEIFATFQSKQNQKNILDGAILNLKRAREILVRKEIESGITEIISEFQLKLLIKDHNIQGLKQWMKQMQFCFSIYPQMKISSKISDILLSYITEAENNLQIRLLQIAKKEEVQSIKQAHAVQTTRKRIEFQQKIQQKQAQHLQQKNQYQLQAKNNKADFDKRFEQLNIDYQNKINYLNAQLIPRNSCKNDSSSCLLI